MRTGVLVLILCSMAYGQGSSVFQNSQSGSSLTEQNQTGFFSFGASILANGPLLPQNWANSHECDVTGGVYDVTKNLGVDYPQTTAGVVAALTQWFNDPDESFHLVQNGGSLLAITSIITLPGKPNATKCFFYDSSTPLPQRGAEFGNVTPVCSHRTIDWNGYITTSNTGNTGTLSSGNSFDTTGLWPGKTMNVGQPATPLTILSVTDASDVVFTSAPGNNATAVPYQVTPRDLGCPNDVPFMATLEGQFSPGNNGLIVQACQVGSTNCPVGPNHYVFQNLEMRPQSTLSGKLFLINLDDGDTTGNAGSHDIWFLNNYMHGDGTDAGTGTNHISALINWASCTRCGALYNYTDKTLSLGNEGHGFQVTWSNTIKIAHNYMEGSSINIVTGGATVTLSPNENNYDWEVRDNYFTKPQGWMTLSGFTADLKSDFECKSCSRWLIDGNLFEYSNTNGGQKGQCLTFTPRNTAAGGFGDNYANAIQDITITNNICRHAVTGIESDGRSGGASNGGGATQPSRRWLAANNLFYDISPGNTIINNATVTQPFIVETGASGNVYNCTPTRAANIADFICADSGTGFHETTMSPGDLALVTGCSDTSFNTSTRGGGFPNEGMIVTVGTVPSGLQVFVINPGAAVSSGVTGCVISNQQGFPQGYTFRHNTIVGGFVGSGGAAGVCPSCGGIDIFAQNFNFSDNIVAPNPSQYAGLLCQGDGNTEGTPSEINLADPSTLTLDFNIFVGRTASKYTDYPTRTTPSVLNWFPTSVCSGTPTSACVGFTGMLNGVAYEANPTNFNDLILDSRSSYKAGGARQADDATDLGANIPKIVNEMNNMQYSCTSFCGIHGPYPD